MYSDGNTYGSFRPENYDILIKYQKKYKVDLEQNVFSGLEKFWGGGSKYEERGTILCIADANSILNELFFKQTYDPLFICNIGSGKSNSLVRYAKKTVEKDSSKVIFILRKDGLIHLPIFLSKSIIENYIEMALDTCQFSEKYLRVNNK
ncbi:MAG: hypothetical protein Q3M24_11155 [Candidatus Electrothrix aestuarii]|uniref:Uncharacterized protein n=1 Tax=Candidatus Electrothrix aestuarii TaxID=3062594 RepID=A0AAU8M2E3_9BACT|nr:hypothetical protein [Candidatus Electrothrix aestuarii]